MNAAELHAAIARFQADGGAIEHVSPIERRQVSASPVTAAADDPALIDRLQQAAPLGVVAMARTLRRSPHTIYRLATRNGITLPTGHACRKAMRARLAPQVRRLARNSTQQQIAAALGITRCVLRHIATEHGIDINSRRR